MVNKSGGYKNCYYITKSWSSTKPGKIIIYSAQNVIIGIDSSLSIIQVWAVSVQ